MKEQIEGMGKLCPFYEEGKCNLLEDEAAECNFNCDMCDFARTLYNAGYRKQEWISVADRLPEKHKEVLVVCLGNVGTDFIATNGRWCEHDHWFVTHWMPLPEPPKAKGGEADA